MSKEMKIILFIITALMMLSLFACDGNKQMNGRSRYIIANGKYAAIYNDRIYYSFSDGFYSMNTDGSNRQMLNKVRAENIRVEDDKIYFSNGYIFSMNIDGTDLKQLNNDDVWGISIADGWIFYNISRNSGNHYGDDGMGIYKMKTDGSELQLLTNDEVGNFIVVDDVIYYDTSSSGSFSIDIDGNNRRQIDDNDAFAIWKGKGSNTIGDRTYYADEKSGRIYSLSADGGDRRELTKDNEVGWVVIFDSIPFDSNVKNIYIFIFKK